MENIYLLILALLILIFITIMMKRSKEHFKNPTQQIVIPSNDQVYDKFYSNIYDGLFGDKAKVLFEVNQIKKHAIQPWGPAKNVRILDVGCGTGWHTKLLSKEFKTIGLDRSAHMLKNARKINNPDTLKLGNANDRSLFPRHSFTHVICLYFTIYYMKNLNKVLQNFNYWLVPKGMLVLHLVDRDNFDPLLNATSPFPLFSLQKYSKKRLTESKVHFNNFVYKGKFDIDNENDSAVFHEEFQYKNQPKVRTQDHKLSMPDISYVVSKAKENGFKLVHKIGMIPVSFQYHYLYIFRKI